MSLDAFLIAKTVQEAQRQREEIRDVIELIEAAGTILAPERRETLERAISAGYERLARIEGLLERLEIETKHRQ